MNKTDRKKWMTLAVMILLICTCSGCGDRHPKMKEALRVGVVTYTQDDPFINAMTDKLKENLKSMETEDMVREARHMVSVLGENTYIKVPVTANGLKAIDILAKEGISVTATAVYGVMPAFMAAKAGAKFLAPYVNRLNNLGYDGVQIAKDIHTMIKSSGYETEVLGASFKNSQQVLEMGKFGIGAVTVNPDTLKSLALNQVAEKAVQDFIQDFEECCGAGKTMLDF